MCKYVCTGVHRPNDAYYFCAKPHTSPRSLTDRWDLAMNLDVTKHAFSSFQQDKQDCHACQRKCLPRPASFLRGVTCAAGNHWQKRLKFWMHLPCCSVPSGLRSCMALLVLASFSQQRNEGSMSAWAPRFSASARAAFLRSCRKITGRGRASRLSASWFYLKRCAYAHLLLFLLNSAVGPGM